MKKFYDPLRKKEVAATPEEAVRQHLIKWLLEDREFPKNWCRVEYQLPHSNYFADFVAHTKKNDQSQLQGVLIAEFKEPKVLINEQVFDQLHRYLQKEKFAYALLSNGREFFFFDCRFGKLQVMEELPKWEELVKSIL